ncbi:peptidase M16 [Kordiimonas sediminis]|uniref:Peptidase M16 n=1 Tax=Kordiimonas sediminis TaxID=1735581 RepID=A0A919APE1_9PROT|nr:pitrilysin family protein [Kordiimonas sediminis]GHF18638.1 peptidase M16 [Kordiimonas sediminis]
MKFKNYLLCGAAVLALAACSPQTGGGNSQGTDQATGSASQSSLADMEIHIPYEKFVLDNGLTVIVHEDRKAPIVAVNVWYHVGSKDEPAGKTGFAHLFEHLMFNGSENFDGELFVPLEKVGGKDLNGTTWFDRTNYYETVPTPALEMALWLESDRMGHLLGAVTQEKLDNQIGVVQNEKRQGDAQPFGKMEYPQLEGLFPPGHPYRHSTIGSMEDLSGASLEDVHAWFKKYYGAANTVVVLSGDVDAATARPLVEKYFGDIPAGPALSKTKSWVPVKSSNQIEEMTDDVPNLRISRTWTVPNRTDKRAYLLRLAAEVLGGGKNSRLYQALVYQSQLASDVSVHLQPFELTSLFEIEVNLKDPDAREKAEQILNETVEKFLAEGATAEEISRAQTVITASTIRGLERIGGGGSKAVTLAQGELYAGDPAFISKVINWTNTATASDVNEQAREWLTNGYYQLTVLPAQSYTTVASSVDRSAGPPMPTTMPELTFPAVEEATLSNGMKVVLANRTTVPIVEMALQFDAGYAADAGQKPGTAKFALAMMDEGTTNRSALEIAAEAESLGAGISSSSNLDVSRLHLNALKPNLDQSLDLFADVVRNPAFDAEEMERLRQRWIVSIDQEKSSLMQAALRLMPTALYDEGHPYHMAYQGSGTKESITNLTREDITAFYSNWLRPDNATVMIAGDITMAEAIPALEKAFGSWTAPATPKPEKDVDALSSPAGGRIILVDQPNSPSTMIMGAQLLSSTGADDAMLIDMASDIYGGEFTSRLNMNIREDKGWSYYAYASALDARGQRMWINYSPIQVDKTRDGFLEMRKELENYVRATPASEAELQKMKETRTNSLPGAFETSGAVLGNMLGNERFGRPYDHVTTLKSRYEALTVGDVRTAASESLKPENMVWLLVGDLSKIEADIRGLGIGTVEVWDKDGNRLR